jgi:hypothetical protein
MTVTAFVLLFVALALTIMGKQLRDNALRDLPAEHKTLVADRMPNSPSVELVPFAVLLLSLFGRGAVIRTREAWASLGFEWLKGSGLAFVALVVLVGVFHMVFRRSFWCDTRPRRSSATVP